MVYEVSSPRECFNAGVQEAGLFKSGKHVQVVHLTELEEKLIREELEFAEKAREAVIKAAVMFRRYETDHLQKSPPDFTKAERNGNMAKMLEDILNPPQSKDPDDFEEGR